MTKKKLQKYMCLFFIFAILRTINDFNRKNVQIFWSVLHKKSKSRNFRKRILGHKLNFRLSNPIYPKIEKKQYLPISLKKMHHYFFSKLTKDALLVTCVPKKNKKQNKCLVIFFLFFLLSKKSQTTQGRVDVNYLCLNIRQS